MKQEIKVDLVDFESEVFPSIDKVAYKEFREHSRRKVTQDISASDHYDFWTAYYGYLKGLEDRKN